MPTTRFAGIDYGTKRIGLALADPRATIVSPAGQLAGGGAVDADAKRISSWAAENEVTDLVVGLPLNMRGDDSDQTRLTRAFADALRRLDANVHLWDERLSSFEANQLLDELGVPPKHRKAQRDALAATVILRSFLAARASDTERPAQ